ncbi:tyrosine-type recombinase/integrase [Hydrogenophaga sp. MI9]|uniref:tyrosine-type recombinase/integrase n=1 Tax=Hydrogenophaga sp. MI9 TaxID=3453719 RepID=UPI003EEA9C81
MARPKKSDAPDLSERVSLSAGAIERLTCPAGKQQAFMRDTEAPGLRVRVTVAGAKSFVFESKLNRQTIRRTIGDVKSWTIEQARTEARRLAVELDNGADPREVKRQKDAADTAERQRLQSIVVRERLTGLEAWAEYVKEGREVGFTERGPWGTRHAADHDTMSTAGGVAYKRKTKGVTQPGPLHPLLSRPLVKIDAPAVAQWLKEENAHRPARAALAFRLLRGFLNWCAEHAVYSAIAKPEAHKPKDVRRLIRKQTPKDDVLQREHLPAWFAGVLSDANPYPRAYLLALLLTGARKNELSHLAWEDVDFRFGGSMSIRDKVDGLRVIPCPAYLAHILAQLPRRGPWVFGAGAAAPGIGDTAAYNHRKALAAGGLPHVSLHGLRRSFGSLAEWVECPAGVVAQLMGHKPSATAEKHYRARPLDLLRVWHEKITAWMLEQAGVEFDPKTAAAGGLRVVNN